MTNASSAERTAQPENWVGEHGDYMFRFACSRVSDTAKAEDLVQETFLAGIKALDRFDGRSSERTWLMAILKNKIIDHYRKSSRETPLEDIGDMDVENSFLFKAFGIATRNPADWEFDPRAAFDRKEFWDVLAGCVKKLKGVSQQAFVLRELEGQSTEEVCKELGLSSNHLWVAIHRARGQLKTCLEKNWINTNNANATE